MSRIVTSVTITDPLVKYNALIATGVYSPDASQHRLALHLQKLYLRLKDYTPAQEYRSRLRQITQAVDSVQKPDDALELAAENHPIRRNPLFARFFQKSDAGTDSLALTRVLTSHQAALDANSPKGLFLSGEVGTGKSMLLDLLAEGLPTSRKKRWHFNTFMLHAFSRLEQFRKSHPQIVAQDSQGQYSLLWMAKEMIEKSPILFLDEFQLPDRAASKIMNNLFIAFFQLGGVLIASSNRVPEELERATGSFYAPPATGGLLGQMLGLGKRQMQGELFGQTSDFAAFLEVLKARCDFWHMEGARDWRRREDSSTKSDSALGLSSVAVSADTQSGHEAEDGLQRPARYFLPSDASGSWSKAVTRTVWQPSALVVYGRKVAVPRQHDGVSLWNFAEIVSSFGPADYITLASNYHTFIIEQVPVLTMSMKNEARRFITLLDALYESRCKLILQAEAGPDDLFFPDTRRRASGTSGNGKQDEVVVNDATYSETIAEVFQDQVSPFRPNISDYADPPINSKYDPDQDSDFTGMEPAKKKVDFGNTSAFTGEDERFAYKRATSRLWQMCSSEWHSRTETLNNLSLTEDQCNTAFPGLTTQIDEVVAQGPFKVKQTGDMGPLQGRIKNGQITVIHAQRKADLSREMINSRTAALHQLHRAILTSPTRLPDDTIFSLNFQDQPFGTAWTYSRPADPLHRPKDPDSRSFLMPHFSFWAWDLPFVGSMGRAAAAIDDLERTYTGPTGWSRKLSKAVWRGTTWFNSVHNPQLRQKLLAAARGKEWADVEALEWTTAKTGTSNASNALPIEDFCRYKYVIHTEGIAYSGRFQFLQMCASVVITPPIQWLQHTTHLVKPLFSSELDLESVRSRREKENEKGNGNGNGNGNRGGSSGGHSHAKAAGSGAGSGGRHGGGGGWTRTPPASSERVRKIWPVQYPPSEANIVFVSPDWSDLEDTVAWLEENPKVAEGIARRQRELFVGGGYFSPAAETCYWRALIKGWAKMARMDGEGWEDAEGISFEAFVLNNGN
ncbi:lactation elevated protein 1 [Diplogelasinospora grovesii]|uniref:Lactation elevated protein 1 n=1 Tax=Diplogelasinospora grovesii TaxID=303347 RepID=A0AAN6N3W5_9PEZI|nr:lactation elevated protein 1 [Diplogelasinospora grovesii]